MKYEIKKPEGTFYSDYAIQNGKVFAIFEHDVRKTTLNVVTTNKTIADEISETDTHLIIQI